MRASTLPYTTGADHLREAMIFHVEAHLGSVTGSFGDLVPGDPAAEVLVVPPADDRPWQTLVSCGWLPVRCPLRRCCPTRGTPR